jgi:hypothetical protein
MLKLDRLVQFDEKSRQFPIRTLVAGQPRSYTWSTKVWLDQGQEGACVGFAWTHDRGARPKAHQVTNQDAQGIYKAAQTLDEWDGEDYSGTSVLAGAKAAQQKGWITSYRWAFGLDDVLLGVSRHGPGVLGINWYEGMWEPDDKGFLHKTGNKVGGHAILCNGVSLKREAVRLHNSWGYDWGDKGEAWLSFSDLDALLKEEGECSLAVKS